MFAFRGPADRQLWTQVGDTLLQQLIAAASAPVPVIGWSGGADLFRNAPLFLYEFSPFPAPEPLFG